MNYFERLRAELARYAEGVHRLGEPARAEDVRGLPDELASFLRSWNGGDLFVDAITLWPASELSREDDLLVFGETATGDRLALDPHGRVWRLEEDTGEALVEGTSFARWLEATVVAEGVIHDREGEFRDGVFDDTGEELLPAAAEKRERKALRIDRDAPAPAWRLAKALARLGQPAKAMRVLEELVERAPDFAWAWFDLGRLRREAGRHAEAEEAFARAAADPGYEHAGYFAAHAARSAAERGDDLARKRHAARALELAPDLPRAQRDAAERLLEEGRRAEALEAAELARVLRPGDLQTIALVKKAQST